MASDRHLLQHLTGMCSALAAAVLHSNQFRAGHQHQVPWTGIIITFATVKCIRFDLAQLWSNPLRKWLKSNQKVSRFKISKKVEEKPRSYPECQNPLKLGFLHNFVLWFIHSSHVLISDCKIDLWTELWGHWEVQEAQNLQWVNRYCFCSFAKKAAKAE
jgi:hypothetical protein